MESTFNTNKHYFLNMKKILTIFLTFLFLIFSFGVNAATVNTLVISAGGGGGGGTAASDGEGGGGGAGGYVTNTTFTVTPQGYTVTIPGGGAGAPNNTAQGSD